MPEHIALDKVEAGLTEIVNRLRESQEGYRELGHRLQNETAKRIFMRETQTRAEYAAELENELHRMGMHDVKGDVSFRAKARLRSKGNVTLHVVHPHAMQFVLQFSRVFGTRLRFPHKNSLRRFVLQSMPKLAITLLTLAQPVHDLRQTSFHFVERNMFRHVGSLLFHEMNIAPGGLYCGSSSHHSDRRTV